MHLFISNSKSKRKVLMFVLVFILSYVTISICIIIGIYLRYGVVVLDDKFAKVNWVYKNINSLDQPNQSVFFIGSSRTRYNISTSLLRKHNVMAYNLGMNGRLFGDYPWVVSKVNSLKSKFIVIDISLDYMYQEPLLPTAPTLEDFKAYVLSQQPFYYILQSVIVYIKRINPVQRYSSGLYSRIMHFFENYQALVASKKMPMDIKNRRSDNKILLSSFYSKLDCKLENFDYRLRRQGNDTFYEIVVACSNGDGVLFGPNISIDTPWIYNVGKAKALNSDVVKLLNYMFDLAHKNNIHPVVLLMPRLHVKYDFDIDLIRKSLHADIIDLSHVKLPDSMWVDEFHLNNVGRTYFTKVLLEYLKPYLRR